MTTRHLTAEQHAWALVRAVHDPEMPMLTLDDLGVLRDIWVDEHRAVRVVITPTYSGCPAMATMRDDLERALTDSGFTDVRIDISLSPAWSSDWISKDGRRKLHEAGYSVPGPAPTRASGPIPLTLTARPREITCPHCGSSNSQRISEFGATLCKAIYRCTDCLEPFDHIKEI